MPTLRIPATAFDDMITAVNAEAATTEHAAFLEVSSHDPSDRLLTTRVEPVPDDDCWVQSTTRCRPGPDIERTVIDRCLQEDRHPIFIHNHPGGGSAALSTQDYQVIARLCTWLRPLCPDRWIGFGVATADEFQLQVVPPTVSTDTTAPGRVREVLEPVPIEVIGPWEQSTAVTPRPDATVGTASSAATATAGYVDRYDRQLRAIGDHGQAALQETHIAVVGCGGIGSVLAPYLARIGVGQLSLIDPDDVEESNLSRMHGTRPGDVDVPKVRVVQEQCLAANPACDVTTVYTPVEDKPGVAQLHEADVIMAGVDQTSTRFWLNEYAVRTLTPYIDLGTRIDTTAAESDCSDADVDRSVDAMEAYVQVIAPGVTACYDCLGRGNAETAYIEQLDPEQRQQELDRGYIDTDVLTPEPAILPVNLMAVTHGLFAVLDMVTGLRAPPALVRYEHLADDSTVLSTSPSDSCVTCGQDGVLAAGQTNAIAPTCDRENVPTPDLTTARIEQASGIRIPDTVTAWFTQYFR